MKKTNRIKTIETATFQKALSKAVAVNARPLASRLAKPPAALQTRNARIRTE